MYRIYDKLQERKDKDEDTDPRSAGGHWRIEVQQRYSESETAMFDYEDYFQDFFSDIIPHSKKLDLSFIESFNDRVMVSGLLSMPDMMNGLSVNSRTKYRKLVNEAKARGQAIDIVPVDTYIKEKSRLARQLSQLLNKTISYVQV